MAAFWCILCARFFQGYQDWVDHDCDHRSEAD